MSAILKERNALIYTGSELTCVFIGHKETYSIKTEELHHLIRTAIEQGVTLFLNGGMGHFDYLCAHEVAELKKEYPQIRSELVIPYLTFQPRTMEYFDSSIYPDGFEKYHFKAAIPKRNRWMVDRSQIAICYVTHGWGGAAQTMKYAIKKNLQIINIGNYTPD